MASVGLSRQWARGSCRRWCRPRRRSSRSPCRCRDRRRNCRRQAHRSGGRRDRRRGQRRTTRRRGARLTRARGGRGRSGGPTGRPRRRRRIMDGRRRRRSRPDGRRDGLRPARCPRPPGRHPSAVAGHADLRPLERGLERARGDGECRLGREAWVAHRHGPSGACACERLSPCDFRPPPSPQACGSFRSSILDLDLDAFRLGLLEELQALVAGDLGASARLLPWPLLWAADDDPAARQAESYHRGVTARRLAELLTRLLGQRVDRLQTIAGRRSDLSQATSSVVRGGTVVVVGSVLAVVPGAVPAVESAAWPAHPPTSSAAMTAAAGTQRGGS